METAQVIVSAVLAALIGYALGGFPSAYMIGKLNGIDIFRIGSGNMGATNVLRALGFKWALLVWLMDTGKGILAVLVARSLLYGDVTLNSVLAGIAAVVGHSWSLPVRLITGKLRGGKGAATAGGTWLIIFFPWAHLILVPLSVMFAVIIATRYVSLAVLATAATGLLIALHLVAQNSANASPLYFIYALAVVSVVYYRHRENIQRLREGRERRIGDPA
ncbi:MAG: acyl-phosphate glycerol 3-phosphate acyltransferase [Candidatus Thermofonsia Clade 1 bacterium]|jgi:glycerol-3-phosphate acyltransferase PlsY|uniref:Glycerol-3-phosphate acyltransferase n=1 Tax=Candidatus Thermofonsia Clade 1 bacterium TaxID=2364210 RepID=A0A2M8PGB7_9CHLR|nr:MAG: acyl-phosphate glycerol 3-phosphate acyltransferase [Candidatus Thermofonsia Clade 1 bacterium]RMF52762.1 MAG: glycerol-3-phosphate 1-O-acyltransferase [Chloroflexota bacterium]